MSTAKILVTRDSSAAEVLSLMLSDHVRYPCLSAMVFQITEALEGSNKDLADDCWSELNRILSGKSDPGSVRRFIARHGAGYRMEDLAFRKALLFLVDEDESRRDQFLSLETSGRRDFVKSRLWRAGEMQIEHAIAL